MPCASLSPGTLERLADLDGQSREGFRGGCWLNKLCLLKWKKEAVRWREGGRIRAAEEPEAMSLCAERVWR